MDKSGNGQSGSARRPAGPSEITYTQTGLSDAPGSSPSSLEDLPPERRAKVERIRKEIQGGKYETREKLERAIEKLLEAIL